MMKALTYGRLKVGSALLLALAVTMVAFQPASGQEVQSEGQTLTYSRGYSVIPEYEGWHVNPDGTIDMWFGYFNQNYREEFTIPVGPNNSLEPLGPDAGQPTHFYPRSSRWQFKVRVPKDFGNRELVWTLTSNGRTYKAYGTLKPAYVRDDTGMQREYYSKPPEGNKAPVVTIVDGETARTVKVGEPVVLSATAIDDGIPRPRDRVNDGDEGAAGNRGGGNTTGAKGLWLGWYVYRGPKAAVMFSTPQPSSWEDRRLNRNSAWSPGWVPPPVPPGNKWTTRATFSTPGTYVVRAMAFDGYWPVMENVTITVTP